MFCAILDHDADIETWKEGAGFNWNVVQAPIMYVYTNPETGERSPRAWDKRQILYRSDTGAPLSVMSDRYRVVQPSEVMDFFTDVCNEFGLQLETAGMLQGGATYWALANTKFAAKINGQEYKSFLRLSTSCNGTMMTSANWTNIKIVCKNTLDFSMVSEDNKPVKCSHSTTFDPEAF